MLYYDHEQILITSKKTAAAKVATIESIIDALLTTVLTSVQKGNVQEYMLNDGQTIIKTVYRNPKEVIDAVGNLRRLQLHYEQSVNSRSVRLVDAKNIKSTWLKG